MLREANKIAAPTEWVDSIFYYTLTKQLRASRPRIGQTHLNHKPVEAEPSKNFEGRTGVILPEIPDPELPCKARRKLKKKLRISLAAGHKFVDPVTGSVHVRNKYN